MFCSTLKNKYNLKIFRIIHCYRPTSYVTIWGRILVLCTDLMHLNDTIWSDQDPAWLGLNNDPRPYVIVPEMDLLIQAIPHIEYLIADNEYKLPGIESRTWQINFAKATRNMMCNINVSDNHINCLVSNYYGLATILEALCRTLKLGPIMKRPFPILLFQIISIDSDSTNRSCVVIKF